MSWFKADPPGEHFCAGGLSELTATENVYLEMHKLQNHIVSISFLSFLLKLFKCLCQGWHIHVWLCVMCSCGPMPTAKSIWCWWRMWPQVSESWHSDEPQGAGLYSISLFSLIGKKFLTYQPLPIALLKANIFYESMWGACHDHCLLIRGGFIAWSDVHGEWHQELTCDGHVIRIMGFHCTGSMAPPSLLKYIRFIRRSNVAFWTDDGPRKMFFLATRFHDVTSRQRRLKDHTITNDAHLHCTHEVPGSDSDVLSQWNIIPSDAGSDAPSEWFIVMQNDTPGTECHGDAVSQCSSSAQAWLDGDDGDIDSYAHASSGLQWLEGGLHFVPDMTIEWLEHGGPSCRLPRLM